MKHYRLTLENKGITKKGQESPVKGHNFGFLPLIFDNLGHLEFCIPLNGMYFWRF